jgi:hypothetical protein
MQCFALDHYLPISDTRMCGERETFWLKPCSFTPPKEPDCPHLWMYGGMSLWLPRLGRHDIAHHMPASMTKSVIDPRRGYIHGGSIDEILTQNTGSNARVQIWCNAVVS